MKKKTKVRSKKPEPVDPKRCQGEKREGTLFSLGGSTNRLIRCSQKPVVVARENHEGEDGAIGQMSLCGKCESVARTQLKEVTYIRLADWKKRPVPLTWVPKLTKAGIYCSTACGSRCTKKAFDGAHRKAKALAKRLGKGWTTRVYENMGWHYNVVSPCRRIQVHEHCYEGKYDYTAFLGEPDGIGGRWAENGSTPKKAVAAVVKVAKEDLAEIGACIKGL